MFVLLGSIEKSHVLKQSLYVCGVDRDLMVFFKLISIGLDEKTVKLLCNIYENPSKMYVNSCQMR